MGRKKVLVSNMRKNNVMLRLSDDELNAIKKRMKKEGYYLVGQYLRKFINEKIKDKTTHEQIR